MMNRTLRWCGGVVVAALAAWPAAARGQEKLEILQPLGRTAYQTNEDIHLAVVRSGEAALPAGELKLTLAGEDGSRLAFSIAVPAAAPSGKDARATEHVYLNGRLLRPGRYALEAAIGNAVAKSEIEVYGHIRRSSYKLIVWGRSKGPDQLCEGEDGMGFNLIYATYNDDKEANFIRAGADFMKCCTMGGAHQMDLRTECDWSDPYVTRGGAVRGVQRALLDRTRPNVLGVHFYDEPGLTWHKHPVTGEWTPHGIPSQVRGYESAFGRPPISYHQVDATKPEDVARWRHWAYWKLSFMDAAWKLSQFGVSFVRPDFLSATQSQYGWSAFTDGYYFNVARCLPVTSGHGGYHDYGLYLFNASWFLEAARARDLAKPCWYLPCWYSSTTGEQFRLEQYLSFQMGIQGLQTPPDIDPFQPGKLPAAEAVVETNKLAAKLGTIFTTMPPTRPPVAMLYSLSHLVKLQAKDRTMNYVHADDHGESLALTYLAGKLIQQPIAVVLDEDVIEGTLAAHHKALILPSVDWVDERVAAGLAAFIADGGLVLTTSDCELKLPGAVSLGLTPQPPGKTETEKLQAELKQETAKPRNEQDKAKIDGLFAKIRDADRLGRKLAAAKPLAEALRRELGKAKIAPPLECDNPGISVTRHAAGDVEYLFAVNAATDWNGPSNNTQPAVATIALADDGRPVYDAVHGGPAGEFARKDGKLAAAFRFGPGQMRIFARPAAAPSGVAVQAPIFRRDYTRDDAPLVVDLAACILTGKGILGGAAPMRIRLIDPLGRTRYDLYRATEAGTLKLSLQLGANDAPGKWTVQAEELLSGTRGEATYELAALRRCGALAGRRDRAIHFGGDRDNIFRFIRLHRQVTVAIGKSEYNQAAAERLAKVLEPWDVKCAIVPAAELAKPRTISPEAMKTWCGLHPGRLGEKNPGGPGQLGFAVEGPVVLLGTPQDNPLIAFLAKESFLPYEPKADVFPGRGRGFLAWQRDGVGHEQESITLIAHDAEGMAEAVGTLYEAQAGLEPLMRWQPPSASEIAPAGKAEGTPEPKVLWRAVLPDRAVAMKADGDKLTILTRDESVSTVAADGKASSPKPVDAAGYTAAAEQLTVPAGADAMKLAKAAPIPGRIIKHVAARGGLTAIGYWGGLVRVIGGDGKPVAARQFPDDVTGLAWLGQTLVVGLSDGTIVGLAVK